MALALAAALGFSTALPAAPQLPSNAPAHRTDDEAPILLDVDGDGRVDHVSPRILELRRWRIPGVEPAADGWIEYFLLFDLETATGRRVESIFRYRLGTENGRRERYRLQAVGDADRDGRGDLAFEVDGPPGAELVLLLDRGDRFEARTSGVVRCRCVLTPDLALVDPAADGAELARWDPVAARFAGEGILWTIGAQVNVRAGPDTRASVERVVPGGSAVRRVGPVEPEAGWLEVEADGARGWISARVVERASPVEPR